MNQTDTSVTRWPFWILDAKDSGRTFTRVWVGERPTEAELAAFARPPSERSPDSRQGMIVPRKPNVKGNKIRIDPVIGSSSLDGRTPSAKLTPYGKERIMTAPADAQCIDWLRSPPARKV